MSEAARPFPSRSPAARRGDVLQPLAAALIALALGFAVQPVTGTRPDWDLVLRILDKLWTVTLVGAIGLVAGRLIWLALVVRSPRPTRDLVGWLRRLALPDHAPCPAVSPRARGCPSFPLRLEKPSRNLSLLIASVS